MPFAIFVPFVLGEVSEVLCAYSSQLRILCARFDMPTSFKIRMFHEDASINDISADAFSSTIVKHVCVFSR